MHRPPWSPAHHEGPPPRRSGVRGGRPRLRATRRSHADAWLRGDARGRDGGVREELVAGAALRSESPLSGKPDIEQTSPNDRLCFTLREHRCLRFGCVSNFPPAADIWLLELSSIWYVDFYHRLRLCPGAGG